MDVIDLLTNDHAEVNGLFARFKQASKPDTKRELANEIVHGLSVHAAAISFEIPAPLIPASCHHRFVSSWLLSLSTG